MVKVFLIPFTYFTHSSTHLPSGNHQFVLYNFFLKCLFIGERQHVSGEGAEREGGGEREQEEIIPSRLCALTAEPSKGFKLTNHEIMT